MQTITHHAHHNCWPRGGARLQAFTAIARQPVAIGRESAGRGCSDPGGRSGDDRDAASILVGAHGRVLLRWWSAKSALPSAPARGLRQRSVKPPSGHGAGGTIPARWPSQPLVSGVWCWSWWLLLDNCCVGSYVCWASVSRGWVAGAYIGSGWGRSFVAGVQRIAGSLEREPGRNGMSGNGVRVSSMGTDVMRDRCAPLGVVSRCVSVADTSLSLSLSRQLVF